MNTEQNKAQASQAYVEIYVSALCPYCHWAKQMLDGKNIAYEAYSVDQNPEKRQEASRRSNRHTVPQIFINGVSVGGFDDISSLQSQGKLDAMLAEPPKS